MRDAGLIIFDCDGVLIDTETVTNALLAECVTEAGWAICAQDSVRLFKGRDLNEIRADVERRVGRALPDLLETYRARMYDAFERTPPALIEGVTEILDALDAVSAGSHAAARPHRCIASNGPVKKMRASLGRTGLLDRFRHDAPETHLPGHAVFSAYGIGVWKPEPDLFLHAARVFGTPPDSCVVIEDSTSGVVAGVRAGMRVIGLAGLTPDERLAEAGAHEVVDSLHDLARRL